MSLVTKPRTRVHSKCFSDEDGLYPRYVRCGSAAVRCLTSAAGLRRFLAATGARPARTVWNQWFSCLRRERFKFESVPRPLLRVSPLPLRHVSR